ncbi:hypothetical protein LTR37_009223 [Vermiconidia calcicola]|uniref:Uncharacterized protein n=1 Tax=Vermiconidia calcicola TaxID=1690605 RepID=A0ACC3N8K9_9PEZI|nr:hypothetical protein LTR37_009223 [Vermiconidia calcicola]
MANMQVPAKRSQDHEFVTISLESAFDTFSVKKSVLCNVSAYFTKALEGSFQETTTRHLALPDCDIDTLQLFLCWLNSHHVPSCRQVAQSLKKGSSQKNAFIKAHQIRLVRLWTFADRVLAPKLQNAAMRAMFRLSAYFRADTIELISETILGNSMLRTVAIESFLYGYRSTGQYGRTYSEAEFNHLDANPNVAAKDFDVVAKSECKRSISQCGGSALALCYNIEQKGADTFIVAED